MNNIANVVGTIVSQFEFSHTIMGEEFYMVYLATKRTSGMDDVLPVMVSSRVVDITIDMQDKRVEVEGSWRSHNYQNISGGRSLKLFIFSNLFRVTEKEDENSITLNATICKPPIYRKTPRGRQITDICLAVNRLISGKSDYLPAIAWSRNALYLSDFKVDEKISVTGRIQSRAYIKRIGEEYEERTAYEVSIGLIDSTERSDVNVSNEAGTEGIL